MRDERDLIARSNACSVRGCRQGESVSENPPMSGPAAKHPLFQACRSKGTLANMSMHGQNRALTSGRTETKKLDSATTLLSAVVWESNLP
jgi:hypothetical protein